MPLRSQTRVGLLVCCYEERVGEVWGEVWGGVYAGVRSKAEIGLKGGVGRIFEECVCVCVNCQICEFGR